MSELMINKARACAVTGHRTVDCNFDVDNLKNVFVKLIEQGYDTFLIGMALGFDSLCFNVLYKLRGRYNIKLIACIPCRDQANKFNFSQKAEYEQMVKVADETVVLSEKYTPYCMRKRNEYLVDNSSVLVAYLRQNFGGTFQTVNYANKQNEIVINV